jgi:5'-3' exonuclease
MDQRTPAPEPVEDTRTVEEPLDELEQHASDVRAALRAVGIILHHLIGPPSDAIDALTASGFKIVRVDE